jgi:hypothetical protein
MNFFRRCTTIVMLALFAGTFSAFAQTESNDDDVFVRGSNRAIAFTLDQLSLDGLDGGIAGRLFIGPTTALRLGLNLNIESTEDIEEGTNDFGRSAFGTGASFLAEWHSASYRRVSPYMGAGFGVDFAAFSTTRDFADGALMQERFKGTEMDFAVNVALGVEVFVGRSVSLAGEHLIGADVILSDTERRQTFRDDTPMQVDMQKQRSFIFGTGTSRLILSVYF